MENLKMIISKLENIFLINEKLKIEIDKLSNKFALSIFHQWKNLYDKGEILDYNIQDTKKLLKIDNSFIEMNIENENLDRIEFINYLERKYLERFIFLNTNTSEYFLNVNKFLIDRYLIDKDEQYLKFLFLYPQN